MKKNHQGRILGRRLARELTRQELEAAAGTEDASDQFNKTPGGGGGVSTWTLTYPADGPYNDSGGGGPILT